MIKNSALLKLDCSKADMLLNWKSIWNKETAIARTVKWYRQFYEKKVTASSEDIIRYTDDAGAEQIEWAKI